ncbi:MAG TPA: hypothetical protein VIF09_16875 [Polyangiaceae bacterium]|jgi:hypothetical protein
MKLGSWLAVGVLGVGGVLLGCNGLLGIGAASLEDEGGAGPTNTTQLTCASYCSVVMTNCTGPNAEYLTQDICNSMCPAFELGGTIADTADDTLGCRTFFANQAASTPDTSCRMAGPLGGGHCGTNPCGPFCDLDVSYCKGDKPLPYEGGLPDCLGSCAGYPYLTTGAGDTTSESGDTLNCRLWHLETANTSDSYGQQHCPHTAKVSFTCNDGGT